MDLEFSVYGQPVPQGSKTLMRVAAKPILVEANRNVHSWRAVVTEAARAAAVSSGQREPMDGALRARITFTMRKPASAPKRSVSYPNKAPDIDKLARTVLDSLTAAGVIVDDSRIVELSLAKRYPGEGLNALAAPGVAVLITDRLIGTAPENALRSLRAA